MTAYAAVPTATLALGRHPLRLESIVGLMDAELVDEAVGLEEGHAVADEHRDREDDAGDHDDGAGADVD